MAVMTNLEFVERTKKAATSYKTLYVLGCFGSPMNVANKKRYTSNNAYNKSRAKIINAASSNTFGFDCVCLLKGILWGWNGNANATYGGAVYKSNRVPDVNADQMMNYCTGVSKNFSNIEVGEFVHMPGHIGVYIGNGLAVECTPIWKDGVQITAVGNIGKKAGYNTRTWTDHGKSKFLNYVKTPTPSPKKSIDEIAKEVIDGKWGNGADRKKRLTAAGYDYAKVQAKVNELLTPKVNYYPKFNNGSLVDGLKSIGVNSSFAFRSKIANKNGIRIYLGTASQNKYLCDLARQGKLIKV